MIHAQVPLGVSQFYITVPAKLHQMHTVKVVENFPPYAYQGGSTYPVDNSFYIPIDHAYHDTPDGCDLRRGCDEIDVSISPSRSVNTLSSYSSTWTSGTHVFAFSSKLKQVDFKTLFAALRRKCSADNIFDWVNLGIRCGVMFNTVPKTSFLHGPLKVGIIPTRNKKAVTNNLPDEMKTKKAGFRLSSGEPLTPKGSTKQKIFASFANQRIIMLLDVM